MGIVNDKVIGNINFVFQFMEREIAGKFLSPQIFLTSEFAGFLSLRVIGR